MKLEQGFSYTGSSEYTVNNINADEAEVSLFDKITGVGGVDYIPYHGSTVTVKTGRIDSSSETNKLQPSLNNKVYYLVSDIEYTQDDKDTIISLATEITVSLDSGTQRYTGDFVFNNPNNYDYLYLIWDYADNMSSGFASYSGDSSTRYIDINFGTNVGSSGVRYDNTGKPSRFAIRWNGSIVADTGYIGLNSTANYNDLIAAGVSADDIKLVTPLDGLVNNGSGDLLFGKTIANINEAQLTVYSPLNSSAWDLERLMPSLNSFYIGLTNGTIGNVCTQTATTNYYHSGPGSIPTVGDIIYTDANGLIPYGGSNAYHLVSLTSLGTAPTSGGKYVAVDENGAVILEGNCDCSEATVPYIYTTDISLVAGRGFDLQIGVNGNPTSWTLASTCNEYVINGGTMGSIFSYTDCNGLAKNEPVGSLKESKICSSTTPLLTTGNGTATIGLACAEYTLPAGISFDNNKGVLFGTPVAPMLKSITLTATNCKGTSSSRTINITIQSSDTIKPFAIDVENFGDIGDAACAVTPTYSLLYHNGDSRVPYVGDTVFKDDKGVEGFNGGDMWYKMDHSTYSIKISSSGMISYKNECPLSTTTTTSTTSTTTTTTLPAGGSWHTAYLCQDITVFAKLYDSTGSTIANNSVIKTTDGNCWKKTTTTTAGYPYLTIENPVVIYANCNTCRGVTTTTTTTTTTTAPTYTAFSFNITPRASNLLACNNPGSLSTRYHNGSAAKPIVGDKIFVDSLGATPFNGGSNWFYMPNSGDYTIRIDNTGTVLNVSSCAGITTTTTTTTAPFTRYLATKCSGTPSGTFPLEYSTSTLLSVGQVVKDNIGDCFTITQVSPTVEKWDEAVALRGTYTYIYFLYDTCLDCQGVTTTTTSTTTTSTTSTTTSSTTTTTTLPPLTAVNLRYYFNSLIPSQGAPVFTGTIGTYYIDGPIGSNPYNIYRWNGSAYVLNGKGWFNQLGSTIGYYWDGDNYSGATV